MKTVLLPLLFITIFLARTTYAADTTGHRQGIILVMLHAEKNRLKEANKLGKAELIKDIKNDAEQVKMRTIMDFSENLTVYPVYYVMDSNEQKIYNKQFTGILLNADGSVANNVPIDTASPNYLIAYYGFGHLQSYDNTDTLDKANGVTSGVTSGMALTVYNSKFEQVHRYYKTELAKGNAVSTAEADKLDKSKPKRYYYKSSKFEMEYYPYAAQLNRYIKKNRQ